MQTTSVTNFPTLFTLQFTQFSTYPHVILNNSLLHLERRPCACILAVIVDTHFTFSPHIDSIITRDSSRINILKTLAATNWGQQNESKTILNTYKSLILVICIHVAHGNLVPQRIIIINSESPNSAKLCPPLSNWLR